MIILFFDWFFNHTQSNKSFNLNKFKLKDAICIQSFNDSQNSAIHMKYHNLLCSSSFLEPRYPWLKVVLIIILKKYIF